MHKELLRVLVLPTQVPQEEQQQTCLNSPKLYNLLLLLLLCLQLQLQLSNLSALQQLQESSREKQFWQWMSEESLQAMVGKTKVATSDEVDIARFFLLYAIKWWQKNESFSLPVELNTHSGEIGEKRIEDKL